MNPNATAECFNQFMEMTVIAEYPKQSADGAAATATPETPIGVIGVVDNQQIPVGPCIFHPGAAVAASDTNYATIQVFKRTAGGAGVLLCQGSTSLTVANPLGNLSAWTPVNLVMQPGAFVTPGDAITLVITKTGTGVVIPASYLAVYPKVT